MNLGFIGTGKIASSVITGISKSKISFKKIIISPRNKVIANDLRKKFKKIIIAKNNQQIVDQCDWIFLSVTPTVGEKIIKDLKFKSKQTIISFISTITLAQLKKAIKDKKFAIGTADGNNWACGKLTEPVDVSGNTDLENKHLPGSCKP